MAPKNPRNNELRKAVLIPLWTFQFFVFISVLTFVCMEINWGFHIPLLATLLPFLLLCIICDVVEIVLYARGTLRPMAYLIAQVVKVKIWLVLFAVAMVTGSLTIVGVAYCPCSLAASLGPMIYASVIVHRQRRLRNADFEWRNMYPRRVSKDSVFGDRVELVRTGDAQRMDDVASSKSDRL